MKKRKESEAQAKYNRAIWGAEARFNGKLNEIGKNASKETKLSILRMIRTLCIILAILYLYLAFKHFGWL